MCHPQKEGCTGVPRVGAMYVAANPKIGGGGVSSRVEFPLVFLQS